MMKTEQIYRIYTEESAGVSTDSRTIAKNQIFFALKGLNYNGNKYAAEAIEKGASYAIIDDPVFETGRTILVDDTLRALQALSAYHRKEMRASVIAITGTNGKTTTKELISAILTKKYKVHYTRGNLNNEIGVPLTILSAPKGTEMMILEMGANHPGEIRALCQIARPDYGIITNIGTAHLEGFGSIDGVMRSKTELYEYLGEVNGIVIYNEKNKMLTDKIYKLINKAVPYSCPAGTGLDINILSSEDYLQVVVKYNNKTYNIKTGLFGKYNLENIKASVATGLFLGIEMDDILHAIEKYQPGNNRSQLKETGNNVLICDAYNANPTSMKQAIDSFAELKADNKVIILGDMLELGEKSGEEHLKILREVVSLNPEEVFLAGPVFSKFAPDFGFISFPDVGRLYDHLKEKPLKGYTILIKGSRGMTLEKIYELL